MKSTCSSFLSALEAAAAVPALPGSSSSSALQQQLQQMPVDDLLALLDASQLGDTSRSGSSSEANMDEHQAAVTRCPVIAASCRDAATA